MVPSQQRLRDNLLVVLHQTQSPDNLGAVARVMTNFGFPRLMLSDPKTFAFQAAEKLAVKGQQVLTTLRIEPHLGEALTDCVYAVGTTSRTELKGRNGLTPEEAVARLAENAARGQVALVLGGEKRGMSDAELDLCQDVLVIPTEPEQPSMNLAQSAAVLLYLCNRQDAGRTLRMPNPEVLKREPGARLETIGALRARMREALGAADYFKPDQPDQILSELLHTLDRTGLSQREAELWLNAFKHVERAIRGITPRAK